MSAYEDATQAAVEAMIFELMELSEPGKWHEAQATWDDTPHSIQAAVNACLKARLITMELAEDGRFRCKLTAAGEFLQSSREGIMHAVCEGTHLEPAVVRWQRRSTPDPGKKVVGDAIVHALCNCSGTWEAFDQARVSALHNDAVKTLQRAGLIDCRVVVTCTQNGKLETVKLPFVISGPIIVAAMERAALLQLVNCAPPFWFHEGKANGAIQFIQEGIIAVRRNTQGEVAMARINAGEADSVCDSIRRRGALGSLDLVPVRMIAEPGIIETASSQQESNVSEVESTAPAPMTWEEAAERLETLRSQGEKFKSRKKFANLFHCSPATVQKAIDKTESLHGWATKERGPAATPFDYAVDNTPQRTEPDPADLLEQADVDAVFAQLIEEAKPDERARLHELTADQKREMATLIAKDPDLSNRIWGSKH